MEVSTKDEWFDESFCLKVIKDTYDEEYISKIKVQTPKVCLALVKKSGNFFWTRGKSQRLTVLGEASALA